MIRCPNCSSEVEESAAACGWCGQTMSSVSQLPTGLASPSVAAAAQRRPASSVVGRLASSESIDTGGFTPGVILVERYRIIGLLGRGGMGEVYRADDLKLGQPVALKFLPKDLSQNKERLERFFAEVRNARQVAHPNVCRMYDIGELGDQHFLSMEYVDGEDLASLLKRIGRLPLDKALDVSRQLCAGLAAAHDRGILHRDLKPANIMLDGRGRARIMDFGLAVAASEGEAGGETSGTPGYMAPEQFAGKGASVQSDLYALGLVLYELSTGKRAVEAVTVAGYRKKHAEESPTAPSAVLPDFDPVVERVILRCLEKDPRRRPASAAQVAAALPGGDPLAAALAAGETPSPEMVAAAGVEGALAPAKAWTLLGAALATIAGVIAVARFATDQGVAPLPKSPDALEDRARELIRSFGYVDAPADTAWWWERQYQYLKYRAAHIPSPRRVRELAQVVPHPWWFWHRQSPRYLVPANGGAAVGTTDPPLEVSGMVNVALDARGNLMRLRAVPPQVETPGAPGREPDWRPLFSAAGLDVARFAPSPPRWLPSEPFDARAGWDGAYASNPTVPIHVAAAAWRGKPVSFEVIGPWDLPSRMQLAPQAAGLVARNMAIGLLTLSVLTGGLLVARRNLRLGRGDRRGAFRVSVFVLTAFLLSWLFSAHHVPVPEAEFQILLTALSQGVSTGFFFWLTYIAIEPIVRRRWPDLLFSWSRLLSGRFRDPLVGRDALAGILVGAGMALVLAVSNGLPNWLDLAGMTPAPPSRAFLGSPGAALGRFFGVFETGVERALGITTLLVLAMVLLRRKWLAIALAVILLVALTLSGENYAVELPAGIAIAALTIFVAARYGILALAFAYFTSVMLADAPVTLDMSRWYAGRGLFLVGLVVALAVYAFRVALGGRPAFGSTVLEG
jgi:Protein kinase domain